MGLTAPSIGGAPTTARDLKSQIKDRVIALADQAEIQRDVRTLAEMSGTDSSGLSKMVEGLGGAFGGLAKGFEAVGGLHQTMVKQLESRMTGTGASGGGIADVLGMLVVMDFLDQRQQRQQDRAQQQMQGPAEESPMMKRYLDLLQEQLAEAKAQRSASPFDAQFQEWTMGLLGQHLQSAADPTAQLKALAELRKAADDVFGSRNSQPPEYSEGALRLRAIQTEADGKKYEHDRYLAGLDANERALAYHYPRIAQQVIAGLGGLAASFGLIPTRDLNMGAPAEDDAAAALAAARGKRGKGHA